MPVLYLVILLIFQWSGALIKNALELPIPGAIVGMLLFLAYLCLSPKQPALETTCNKLISVLPLFFIPAGVGLLGYLAELKTHGLALSVALIVGTALGFVLSLMVLAKLLRSG